MNTVPQIKTAIQSIFPKSKSSFFDIVKYKL
jgi:hypothetical protein